jgi:uncharacterized membrane-anchored protein
MKLDFRDTAREKLSNLQDTASGLDLSDTLVRLMIVGLLPFTACLIILFATPDLKTKLAVDSILVAVILWVGGGALYATLKYFEERKKGRQSTGARSLFDAGVAVLASLVTVALIYVATGTGR